MIPLIVILSTALILNDPFNPGEMGPAMLIIHELDQPSSQDDYTQTLQLHEGWNLVSWHIWPSGMPEVYQAIAAMLPDDPEHSWFHTKAGTW